MKHVPDDANHRRSLHRHGRDKPLVRGNAFISAPVGAITELVEGDVYHGGWLTAALFGSVRVILYSFSVKYYVPSPTGAVKE